MLLSLLLCVLLCQYSVATRCDRQPDSVSSARQTVNIPFSLGVESLPPVDQPEALPRPASAYLPGQDYIVKLVADDTLVRHFTDFTLTVESVEDLDTGSFSPSGNTYTKFSERCRNAVVQTSSMPKLDVWVFWRAPPPGSGCVVFRASVVEMKNLWYMDDGPLSLELCEEQTQVEAGPTITDPCCACEEAKYEMAFEGLWSRHTHPKDFPKDHFKAEFSDVIGASHMVDYRFWNYGEFASKGLKELAEQGSTRTLESELKEKSQHIRTIIKARGIGYPNVTGKTFAVFRVDRNNHLVSVVSKIAPSPDWIVGVSGLELCDSNCTWIEKQKVELYPWDVGTDSGVTYESDDSPSIPAEPILKISSNYPNDPLSPFYDTTGGEDMKPLAILYVTRQRLYEKDNCKKTLQTDVHDNCAVTEWSAWSPCSVSCGEGHRTRRRSYQDPNAARASSCRARHPQVSRISCTAAPCRERQRPGSDVTRCDQSEWSEWSPCSASCGRGYHTRTRHYTHVHSRAYCSHQPGAPKLEETQDCEDSPCGEEEGDAGEDQGAQERDHEENEGEDNEHVNEGEEDNGGEVDGEDNAEEDVGQNTGDGDDYREEDTDRDEDYTGEDNEENPEDEGNEQRCPRMTEWTAWSPCSVTCGSGTRMRNRYEDTVDDNTQMIANIMRRDYEQEADEDEQGEDDEDCDTRQEEECEGQVLSCEPPTEEEREICLMDKEKGPCYSIIIQWYFDKETLSCQKFEYGGCRGNRNKFNTRYACEQMCGGVTVEQTTTEGGPFGGLVAGNQITNIRNLGIEVPPTYPYVKAARSETSITSLTGRVLDCVVSDWSRWSACSATCGTGYKQRTRTIKVSAVNGGKACPRKLLRMKRCRHAACENLVANRPLHRRHSQEVNYENSYVNSVEKNELSGEDVVNEIRPLGSSNEITQNPAARAEEIRAQTFHMPPFIRILHSGETNCELSEWTEWSSCSMTCGTNAYRQRTRSIITQPSDAGRPCDKRIEVQPCMLRPCTQ